MKTSYLNIFKFWIVSAITVVSMSPLAGCSDDFLKQDPLSFYTPEKVYETESGLQAALATSDKQLRDYYVTGKFITDYVFSDLAVRGQTDLQDQATNLDEKLTPTSTPWDLSVNFFWDEGYAGVKYANTVISNIDKVAGLEEKTRNAYLGRAYFHRSYRYYMMAMLYNNIPLVAQLPTIPKINYKSLTRDALIDMLVHDMEFAVEWVPEQSDMSAIGMVNKEACRQLLIKIYLADGQYQKAKDQADILIDRSDHRLMQSEDNFGTFISGGEPEAWKITPNIMWNLHRPENKLIATNKETLLGVVYMGDGASFLGNETMRNYGPFWNDQKIQDPDGVYAVRNWARNNKNYSKKLDFLRAIGRGIANLRPSYYAYQSVWYRQGKLDEGDMRHSSKLGNWFPMDSLKYNDPDSKYYGKTFKEVTPQYMADTIRSWFPFQHYKLWLYHPSNEANMGCTNFNGAGKGSVAHWYVFRLAETYLLRAEANFYLGHADMAAKDVNEIRKRAKCDFLYPEDGTLTIGDIMDERARELYLEEFRHVELNRVSLCLAMSGKSDEWGNKYDINTFDKQEGLDSNGGSYWYQRVVHYNDFYKNGNAGISVLANGKVFFYKLNKRNIYYPIPNGAITKNSEGKLMQNFGYDGYDEDTEMWTSWEDAAADETK